VGRANAVPTRKGLRYHWLGVLAEAQSTRQKGLVDHVCPASFS
jgi:hypothetical protein